MFESKYAKHLTIILIVVISIIVLLLGFLGFNLIRNYYINSDAQDAVEKFEGKIENDVVGNKQVNNENTSTTNEVITPIISAENIVINNDNNSSSKDMYKGYVMVGTIEIPKTKVSYPVLEKASKGAIEVAVAVYYGPGLNKVGNTTISGHNYRNGTFFSDNKKLAEGDKIYITDTSKNKVTYTIYKTYTTSPEDSEYLSRDTEGRREISLTTCTDDAKSRLIIWAKAD